MVTYNEIVREVSMYLFFFVLSLFCSVSCSTQYSDFFPYHDDGTLKPYVSILPLGDHSNSGLAWNLSEELTGKVRHRLMQDGRLFVPPATQIHKQLVASGAQDLTTSADLAPFLSFQPAHFVVVMDLIEHRIVPYQRGAIKPIYPANIASDRAVVLLMKLRLRVVDIRGGQPHVVRQELVESNHVMDKLAMDESIHKRGTPTYGSTALAMAHARLVSDVVAKIEQLTCFRG